MSTLIRIFEIRIFDMMTKLIFFISIFLSFKINLVYAERFEKGSFKYNKVIKNGKIISKEQDKSNLKLFILYDGKIFYCDFNSIYEDEVYSFCKN